MQTILLGLLTVAMVANPLRNAFILTEKRSQNYKWSVFQLSSIYTERNHIRHMLGYSEAAEGASVVS